MRIGCITDLHIGAVGQNTHGVDTRANLIRMLDHLEDMRVDQLVLLGDLCYTQGDRRIYEWLLAELDKIQIPYYIIPGNHDHSVMMAETFGVTGLLKNDWLYYRNDLGKMPSLFLDTSGGIVSHGQIQWVKKQLSKHKKGVFIFMHHPPLNMGTVYMDDQHALKSPKEFLKLFAKYKGQVHVFCGHYHHERSRHWKNLHVHITPSLFFQIDPDEPEFTIDHYNIACRIIDLQGDGITHFVQYLPGSTNSDTKLNPQP